MTAHCNLSKKVYCAIWSEATVGRSGNDLACAVLHWLVAILADNPNIKNIITWSDSCVPQNRNSIISTVMIHFLIKKHTNKFHNYEVLSCWTFMYSRGG